MPFGPDNGFERHRYKERNCHKMKLYTKIVAGIIAASMLVAFAGCARTVPPEDFTTTTGTTTVIPEINELKTVNTDGINFYTNPLITRESHGGAAYSTSIGVGDPFVMRWNGKYYMYPSSGRTNMVYCWTSDDLVNWKYEGRVAKGKELGAAYAPEVTYYNGWFYMVTSPNGGGHYTLRSKSPLGPFEFVTDNWGHKIDGHIFIDDDGKWYFYSANGEGIMVYPMSSPIKVSNTPSKTGAYMDGWTEGPMVIKYNGVYYLTYTGNHVLSRGYHINYGTSTKSCKSFNEGSNSPILLNTGEEVYAIGHSSTVMGPNLDSYYIVYHSRIESDGSRRMNIDRLELNGTYMEALGPTVTGQQTPQLPDISSSFVSGSDLSAWTVASGMQTSAGLALSSGGSVLSNRSFGKKYTAEINMLGISGGSAGAVFGYTDDNNFGLALFDVASQQLVVIFTVNGESEEHRVDLVKSFNEDYDFSALQMITVRRDGTDYKFLVNNRELASFESKLGDGKIGVRADGAEATVGFVAATEAVNQSSMKDYFKPVPGSFQAINCMEDDFESTEKSTTSVASVKIKAGKYYNYTVNISGSDGKKQLDLSIEYRSTEQTQVEIYQNGTIVGTVTLPASPNKKSTAVFRGLELDVGLGTVSFRYADGGATVTSYEFTESTEVTGFNRTFEKKNDLKGNYTDGEWTVSDGKLRLSGTDRSIGKILFGNNGYGDYTVSADLSVSSIKNGSFGLIVRGTNPANGKENSGKDRLDLGTNYLQGYCVSLTENGVVLSKINYNFKSLKTYKFTPELGKEYNLKVVADGATLTVYLDGAEIIRYTDSDPFICGGVGIRGVDSVGTVDNFILTKNLS